MGVPRTQGLRSHHWPSTDSNPWLTWRTWSHPDCFQGTWDPYVMSWLTVDGSTRNPGSTHQLRMVFKYLPLFIGFPKHPRWCRISAINSIKDSLENLGRKNLEDHPMTCKWIVTMISFRPLSRVVGPLPNGPFMADKLGVILTTSELGWSSK